MVSQLFQKFIYGFVAGIVRDTAAENAQKFEIQYMAKNWG